MNVMLAFAMASVMLSVGVIFRAKLKFLKDLLVPASVIGGIVGLIVMNFALNDVIKANTFTQIANHLFTLTFISIGLTAHVSTGKKDDHSAAKNITKGSIAMGFLWNIMYALGAVVGGLIILLIGNNFSMEPVYGMLIPLGFTQGPGPAAAMGTILEQQHGLENAAMVAMTFSAIGFIVCFVIGVPLAKKGIKIGLSKNIDDYKINEYIKRGFYKRNEKSSSLGKETTYSGNIDTLSFHFSIIGISYLLGVGIAELIAMIPGFGENLSALLFLWGMVAAYIIKFIMQKLDIDYLLNNTLQTKITAWSTDYIIVSAFMAIQLSVLADWLIPILIESLVITVLTFIISIYFGQRIGGRNDFERTLALFGSSTATVPSGVMLLRIVDPNLETTTKVELGTMNIPMMLFYITIATIMSIASGGVSLTNGFLLLAAPIPIYLILLKLLKLWGKKTYSFKEGENEV
ncbi:MAG: sodium/glutamate symporter [Bacillota bacterium]